VSHGENFAQWPSVGGSVQRALVVLVSAGAIDEDRSREGTALSDEGVDDGTYVAQQELLGKIGTDGVHTDCSREEGAGVEKEGEVLGTIWADVSDKRDRDGTRTEGELERACEDAPTERQVAVCVAAAYGELELVDESGDRVCAGWRKGPGVEGEEGSTLSGGCTPRDVAEGDGLAEGVEGEEGGERVAGGEDAMGI
jgi:hypothetical protein